MEKFFIYLNSLKEKNIENKDDVLKLWNEFLDSLNNQKIPYSEYPFLFGSLLKEILKSLE